MQSAFTFGIFVLPRCYIVWIGSQLSTFQDNVKQSKKRQQQAIYTA